MSGDAIEPPTDSWSVVCEVCGRSLDEHSAFVDEPRPEVLARLREARFPGQGWRGLYCPEVADG